MKYYGYYNSPIGRINIEAEEEYITSVYFKEINRDEILNNEIRECKKQLEEYFNKKRKKFNLNIKFESGTEFQQKVWKELINIPFGKTATYKEVAEKIGHPKAYRAVGGANNKNPLLIIIPCHRIVGSNSKLIGYAGGIDKKEQLLNLEG